MSPSQAARALREHSLRALLERIDQTSSQTSSSVTDEQSSQQQTGGGGGDAALAGRVARGEIAISIAADEVAARLLERAAAAATTGTASASGRETER